MGGVPAGVDPTVPVSRSQFRDVAARVTDPVAVSPALLELRFDVPRSVSALWATQSEEIRVLLTETVLRAVDDTVQMLDSAWVFARRGAGGVAQVAVASPVAVCAFMHYFDRQGKPGLHVHIDVINVVLGSDGQASGMDVSTFRSADELAHERYASSLMSGLRELVGVASDISYGDDRRTHFEVAGVDPELIWDLPRVPLAPGDPRS
ncbi:relaxase domain-containing protein [Clavibacter sp. VKM Ac-2872]|uniref:relaxase domain-containing protein n=1 Tax=Clavibacter sp. VKM Ac-2872 TaxID=2783812 RepID=UPI001E5F2AD6|nr:relaxase domain-containing protein [Clavibacter sp. VKM Ac-2872]